MIYLDTSDLTSIEGIPSVLFSDITIFTGKTDAVKSAIINKIAENEGLEVIVIGKDDIANGLQAFTAAVPTNEICLLGVPECEIPEELSGEIARFITDMTELQKCQFIIASDSPAILSIPEAKVYDLDHLLTS
ncbi:MAG: hypothetical protein MJY86_09550 [Bacteroidales bacterium]|nr:hypothetical protein [Candidatus Cryptobacteroides faecihippi]MCQ2163503.1 hypothetical protein [Bacteroidales bacterium]